MPALTYDEVSMLAAIAYEFDGELKTRPRPSVFDSSADSFVNGKRWGANVERLSQYAQDKLRAMFNVAQELYRKTTANPPTEWRQLLEDVRRMPNTDSFARQMLVNTLETLAQQDEHEKALNRCPTCGHPRSNY